jgi:hypothetical protein
MKTVLVYQGPPFGGMETLVAEGERRTKRKYFLFPKTLRGVRRRGWQEVVQTCVIRSVSNTEGTIYHNKWLDLEFLDEVRGWPQ